MNINENFTNTSWNRSNWLMAALCLVLLFIPPARSQPLVIDSYSCGGSLACQALYTTSNMVWSAAGPGPGTNQVVDLSVQDDNDNAGAYSDVGFLSCYGEAGGRGMSSGSEGTSATWTFHPTGTLLCVQLANIFAAALPSVIAVRAAGACLI